MISASLVRKAINRAASAHQPFIFGVDFEINNGFFFENPFEQQEIFWRIGSVGNYSGKVSPSGTYLKVHPTEETIYNRKFDTIKRGLMRGDSFLTNLTIKTPIEMDYSFEEIFSRCNSQYAVWMPNRFVCFSPETFIKIDEEVISSNPMKGTIKASVPNAEAEILSNYKERAEHFTIVDLIRNDLSMVASEVHVEQLRYIDKLQTSQGDILQVSSKIVGKLNKDDMSQLGDQLFSLLQAGSVSGAPKRATISLIQSAEQEDRGYYCGVFGYFDGSSLDSAVLIRYIEQHEGSYYFRSGGGITVNSDAESEYNEVNAKIYLPFR